MPYLKSEVIDLQLPDFFNHLIPIFQFGVFYDGDMESYRNELLADRGAKGRTGGNPDTMAWVPKG